LVVVVHGVQRHFQQYSIDNGQLYHLRFAAASDKVYQLLAHGRWFSPGTPASSNTKTGRHDIAEIFLKVALNTKNQSINQSRQCFVIFSNINCLICN
jgi:hypothetical protein